MRRALTGGFLALLFLGPFAAQVEAAEAFACSIAELIHPDVIEPEGAGDPGFGDVTLQIASHHHAPHQGQHALPVFEGLAVSHVSTRPGFNPTVKHSDDPPWPSHDRSRRLASLQIFLC